MAGRRISPNLALDHYVAQRQAQGESIVHLGFGEARLPVFGPLVEALTAGARRNAYGPVAGAADVREAVAGYFTRRDLPTGAEQIIVAPGSKPLLLALQLAVPGDLLLHGPAWNTYAPQAELAGKRVFRLPLPEDCGGVPEPRALREGIRAARADGGDPRIIILTLPDNPTGTLAQPRTIREICAIAEEEGLLIVSDEIYRDLLHDPELPFLSPAEVLPEQTVVITGLSKNLALGGWRIGVARFPAGERGTGIREDVASLASEIWSTLAGPMQEVAAYAFAEPPELRRRLAADARLHAAVAAAVHRVLEATGARCRRPTAGFYLYPDFEPLRSELAPLGIRDSETLQGYLLRELGVAVLAGHHLGDDKGALRFRIATSMMYGATEEERAASVATVLAGGDPLALPHVARVLAAVQAAFTRLLEDAERASVPGAFSHSVEVA